MLYYKDLLDGIIKDNSFCEDISGKYGINYSKVYSIFKVSAHEVKFDPDNLLFYLLIVLRTMGFDNDNCRKWFHDVKIPYYNDKSPLEIIQNNEGEKLINDLVDLQLGHTGG